MTVWLKFTEAEGYFAEPVQKYNQDRSFIQNAEAKPHQGRSGIDFSN
jgi:hypothetical protein